MKEIDMEALDRMFPDGYVIAYTLPQGEKVDVRLSYYNPDRHELLYEYYDVLKDFSEQEP